MMDNQSSEFLAIDLGATSGRAILGKLQDNMLELEEINRFPNPIVDIDGFLHWDIFYLYSKILESISKLVHENQYIDSIGIDTWGVDFASFAKDGQILRMPYCYRDTHTFDAPDKFFQQVLSKKETYLKTGIQIMHFNSLFQLFTQKEMGVSTYPLTDKFLFMPDALSYLLTGNMVTEYTIASTSQLLNPFTRQFDKFLLSAVGLCESNFAPIVFPGTKIGTLSQHVQQQTGADEILVIAVAGHDTASAVLATPAENENFAYLSSGTWSLMGIETSAPIVTEETYSLNFTNEGGVENTIRLLKNICGMWLIERCRDEWQKEKQISYDGLVAEAENAPAFKSYINPDAARFTNPDSMITAIQSYCKETNQYIPDTVGEIARCIYESLAFRYKQVFDDLQKLASYPIENLHIIGGGSQNNLLNRYTANAIGKPVIAGPSEATAMGNVLMQAKAANRITGIEHARKVVRNSVQLETFLPENKDVWETQYNNYLKVYQTN